MTKVKHVHVKFNTSKQEDRILYDALLRYPDGVRSHIMRTALAAFFLKATDGNIIPERADLHNHREAPMVRSLSMDHTEKSLETTHTHEARKNSSVHQPAKIAASSGGDDSPKSGKQSPEELPSNIVPELNEAERLILQGMLIMIQ